MDASSSSSHNCHIDEYESDLFTSNKFEKTRSFDDSKSLLYRMYDIVDCIAHGDFDRSTHDEIKLYVMPGHYWRYWHYYAVGTVVTLVTARHLWVNREAVSKSTKDFWVYFKAFTYEHLVEPLNNIYKSVTDTLYDRSKITTSQAALTSSKESLEHMLKSFGVAHPAESAQRMKVPIDQYVVVLPEKAKELDMNIIMGTYEREIKKPIKGMLLGDLLQGILIQIQKVKVDAEAAMLTLDQILRANTINFNILATIPAILLLWGVTSFFHSYLMGSSMGSRRTLKLLKYTQNKIAHIQKIFILQMNRPWRALYQNGRIREQVNAFFNFSNTANASSASTSSSSAPPAPTSLPLAPLPPSLFEARRLELQNMMEELSEHHSLSAEGEAPEMNLYEKFTGIFFKKNKAKNEMVTMSLEDELEQDIEEEEIRQEEIGEEKEYEECVKETQSEALATNEESPSHTHSTTNSTSSTTTSQAVLRANPRSNNPNSSLGGLSPRVYGQILLTLYQLSDCLAALPVTHQANFPRILLHRDLITIADLSLTPNQKYFWIQNMLQHYPFLLPTEN